MITRDHATEPPHFADMIMAAQSNLDGGWRQIDPEIKDD